MSYDHKKVERKWQDVWSQNKIYTAPDSVPGKDNFYLLVEFPYPSGNLHVGHWYAFAVPDILARYQRMQGKNVMFPIGFDAFGLPAENAAIKNKLNPREWTEKNIAYMTKQIESMGTSFDWSRKVSTIDPAYYRWTQWLFLQLHKKGLVYQKETAVNWCPKDKTVLANEQVVDGKCERCGTEVEQRQMLQWNIKITDYADRLIDDLEALDWPEQIKESQRNWIGRSEGAEIDFGLDLVKKYKFVILHGWEGSPDMPRWQWVKKELEAMGHAVVLPRLPHTENPLESEQVEAALAATEYDENTVLVGHSLGAVVALKVAEKLKTPIARLVTIGGFIDRNFKDGSRSFEENWRWEFDGSAIKHIVKSITVLHDPQDYAVSNTQAEALAKLLDTKVVLGVSSSPHFTGEKEPDVLMWLRPTIRVFTTRPDTLFGATYLVLAPEHPWVTLALGHKTVLKNNEEVQTYVDRTGKMSDMDRQTAKEKTGVKLEGVEAINPATGEKIPLYVADYVLGHYGTGAIMAVPAHDERDYEFAKKFDLPIQQVIEPVFVGQREDDRPREGQDIFERPAITAIVKHWSEDKYLILDWKQVPWHTLITGGIEEGHTGEETARREVLEETGYKNLKLIRPLPIYHSKFFHTPKNRNQFAHFQSYLFVLINDERSEVSADEQAKHEVRWVAAADMEKEITPNGQRWLYGVAIRDAAILGEGVLGNSREFNLCSSQEAKQKMIAAFGRAKKTYRLRDWIVSRQRYWGVPIPMIHCEKCGSVPVPEKDLPVELPEVEDYLPEGSGKSPLAKVDSFVNISCPQCGGAAQRETDTLDTFVDSSWYFLRYTDPKNSKEFTSKESQAHWMPVDLYSGGAEHTTMHLLYSRFWHKALYDMGLVADPEPYKRRMNRSIILGPDGQKMSKSHGNVIDPDEVVERLGADTVRMYLAFIGPYNEVSSFPWNPDGVVGVRRFLERVWRLQEKVETGSTDTLSPIFHKTIKKVGEDIAEQKFNTAISQLMILLNALEKTDTVSRGEWQTLLTLLAPFAPHMAEELWHAAGNKDSVHSESWPVYDDKYLVDDTATYAIQVNGKIRGEVSLPRDAHKDAVEQAARAEIASRLEGKTVSRVIVVPNRLVNFVVQD